MLQQGPVRRYELIVGTHVTNYFGKSDFIDDRD